MLPGAPDRLVSLVRTIGWLGAVVPDTLGVMVCTVEIAVAVDVCERRLRIGAHIGEIEGIGSNRGEGGVCHANAPANRASGSAKGSRL